MIATYLQAHYRALARIDELVKKEALLADAVQLLRQVVNISDDIPPYLLIEIAEVLAENEAVVHVEPGDYG